MSVELGIFKGRKEPDVKTAWEFYSKGCDYNRQINLDETVKVNENFYVGKQWEGVQANGLPTPVFNFLKRVVGFITATSNSDNIKVNASALDNTPDTDALNDPVRIVNEEFEALVEHNSVPSLNREFTRNAAVDGDGCTYTYWDEDVPIGGGKTGAIRTEILPNTRVFFGNPNDRSVQDQPYIQIASREIVRRVMKRAKANDCENWEQIQPDDEATGAQDEAKSTDDKATVILTLWKDEETGEVWGYESTRECEVRKPWNLNIRLYPITWLNWDYIQDSYHGQAMITGLIPNQIFVNKAWAMSMLSMMRSAWPKFVYDKTRIAKWDNRVGSAIGIAGGDINNVAKVIDGAPLNPQVSNMITQLVKSTEESMGATGTAMGEGRADNTSAIIALQRAAATPSELTKQNLYQAVEDLYRIYLEFMSEYYGKRPVDMEPPEEVRQAAMFAGMEVPDQITMDFDFKTLRDHPMTIKLDVGASSYYSEIASIQTLDNLLQTGQIDVIQYLERIPDGYVPARRALVAELKARRAQQEQMAQMQAGMPPEGAPEGNPTAGVLAQGPELHGGSGYSALQRMINQTGEVPKG